LLGADSIVTVNRAMLHDKWLTEHCAVLHSLGRPDLEFGGTLLRTDRLRYFGLRLIHYFSNVDGQTTKLAVRCEMSYRVNIAEVYLVIREYDPISGKLLYAVHRPTGSGLVELYLTSRQDKVSIQGALIFEAAGEGQAKVDIQIAESFFVYV